MVLAEFSRFPSQLKYLKDTCSPFSDSMRWSTCKLGTGFNRRFRQEQLGLLQIFGCNTQRKEKHVCFCCTFFVCLFFFFFLPLIWTLQEMVSDIGCAQIEFFSLYPFRFMSRFFAKLAFWPLRQNAVIKQLVQDSGVKSQLGGPDSER